MYKRPLWWTLLLVAGALRLGPLLVGKPAWHPDEFNFVYWPLLFFDGDLNPDFFYYPHFHYYLLASFYALFFALQSLLAGWSLSQSAAHYYFWQADDILLIGRLVSALMGVGTVLWLALIARRLYGDSAALATAALAAVSVLAVRQAPLAAADVPMTFWFVAALWAALRLSAHERARDYALAGLLVGLAAASKYHGALIAVALIAAHVQLHRSLFDKRLWLSALISIIAFALTSPYVLIEYERFIQDFRAVVAHTAAVRGDLDPAAWYHARFSLLHNLGYVGSVLALAGIWRSGQSAEGRVLLVSFATYYIAISSGELVFVRYALPAAALQCLLAAGGLTLVRPQRWGTCLLVLALAQPFYNALSVTQLLSAQDTRAQARQWIEREVPAGSTLANFGGWAGDPQIETFEHLWWRTKYYVWNAGYEQLEAHLNFFEQESSIPPFYHYAIQAGNGEKAQGDLEAIDAFSTPYALLHRHPLGASHIDSLFAQQLPNSAQRVATFAPQGLDQSNPSYDPLDAYYVPLAHFNKLQQPGPAIEIWRVAHISTPPPRTTTPLRALAAAYMSGARGALAQEDPASYVRLSARALLLDPGQLNAAYQLNLGIAHRRLGHFQKALAQWRQALLFDSTFVAAHYNSGLVHRYDLDNTHAALRAWQRALTLDAEHLASREQLAIALGEERQYQEAEQHWLHLLERKPDYVTAHLNLGIIYRHHLNEIDKARSHLNKVLDLRPDHPQNEEIRAFLRRS